MNNYKRILLNCRLCNLFKNKAFNLKARSHYEQLLIGHYEQLLIPLLETTSDLVKNNHLPLFISLSVLSKTNCPESQREGSSRARLHWFLQVNRGAKGFEHCSSVFPERSMPSSPGLWAKWLGVTNSARFPSYKMNSHYKLQSYFLIKTVLNGRGLMTAENKFRQHQRSYFRATLSTFCSLEVCPRVTRKWSCFCISCFSFPQFKQSFLSACYL